MLPNWLYGKSKSKLASILGGGGTPADYNQVKAQVAQNTEDIALLSDGLDDKAALTQITNPNLLDNPWFTVNQRGGATYSLSDYTVDRWSAVDLSASGNTISINDGLICTASGEPSKSTWIRQYFDGSVFDGSVFTASMIIESSVAIKTYLQVRASDNTYLIDSYGIDVPANTPTVVKISNGVQKIDGLCYIRTFFNYAKEADAVVKIKAIKLEKGSVSTLAMDTAPNYTTELLKCQRYFHKYATETLRPSNMYDCVPEMRATPAQSTITIDGTTYYVNSADL